MRNPGFGLLTVTLMLGLLPGAAQAWNKPGHMASAAIAYAELKQSHPDVLARVIKLLKQHPHHDRWAEAVSFLPPEDQDLAVFMRVARWPDDIRDDPRYNHDRWHYINFPFKPPGQPATVKAVDPPRENILSAFEHNAVIAGCEEADADDRAIAVCWVFHLIGDIHQPLHSSTLFTSQFPQGDRGGTRFYIRATAQAATTVSLHTYWDGLTGSTDKFQTVRNKATKIRMAHPRDQHGELSNKEFPEWAAESFALAKTAAYRDGKLLGSRDEVNGAALPADYAATVKPIAYRRMALAGYRLADVLVECFRAGD